MSDNANSVKEGSSRLSKSLDDPLSKRDPNKKEWVKFEEDDSKATFSFNNVSLDNDEESTKTNGSDSPAVLATESVHVTIDNTPKTKESPKKFTSNAGKISQPAVISVPDSTSPTMRTIELSTGRVQEGFANGDIIVTLLPVNMNFPWITPAVFRPELVPEELMAQGLTLTVEDYVHAMETLVNDYRFTLYNVCYKRVLVCWVALAFSVLLGLLFSGIKGILLFSLGVSWLFLNAVAIFLCMWVKLRLARGLEQCLARVNKQLLRHKILMALDDRGNMSCHKVNLCFIYFDVSQCISYINNFLERREHNGQAIQPGWEAQLDVETNDIIIQGSNSTRISRKQDLAAQILLRYLQRWGKDFLRHRLDWQIDENGISAQPRRHLRMAFCPCQYAEEVLISKKPESESNRTGCCDRGEQIILRYSSRWGHEMFRGFLNVSNVEPARHSSKHLCPCQFIECHLKCKPEGDYCWSFSDNNNHMYPS